MTYFLVALTTFGYTLNMREKLFLSYLVWLVTNSFWIYVNYSRGSYDMCLMFTIYLFMCLLGIYKTRKR